MADKSENGIRAVVYFLGNGSQQRAIFEGWRRSKIYWRVEGKHVCSNGIVVCYANVPLNNGEEVGGSTTFIYEGDEPRYLVIDQLHQTVFRAQVYGFKSLLEIVATWFQPKPSEDQKPHILLPSVYKFIGCLKGDELEAGNEASSHNSVSRSVPKEARSNASFSDKDICERVVKKSSDGVIWDANSQAVAKFRQEIDNRDLSAEVCANILMDILPQGEVNDASAISRSIEELEAEIQKLQSQGEPDR